MSWNLLTFAIPLCGVIETSLIHTPFPEKFEKAPESPHASVVKAVAERIFNSELQPGEPYNHAIKKMIEKLPDSVGQKNVASLIATRLRVVTDKDDTLRPAFTVGTNLDLGPYIGRYFIGIYHDLEQTEIEALPWIATHEICHILEADGKQKSLVKTITSLSVTILSTLVLRWSLLPCLGLVILTNAVAHIIMSRRAENRADDFANRHCSVEEKRLAVQLFTHFKKSDGEGVKGFLVRVILSGSHPSTQSRIEKIQAALSQ